MGSVLFTTLLFVPSMALAFGVLASFYGPARAYLAIAAVPAAATGVVAALGRFDVARAGAGDGFAAAEAALAWAGLVQAGLGLVLAERAYVRHEGWAGLAAATLLSGLPFALWR